MWEYILRFAAAAAAAAATTTNDKITHTHEKKQHQFNAYEDHFRNSSSHREKNRRINEHSIVQWFRHLIRPTFRSSNLEIVDFAKHTRLMCTVDSVGFWAFYFIFRNINKKTERRKQKLFQRESSVCSISLMKEMARISLCSHSNLTCFSSQFNLPMAMAVYVIVCLKHSFANIDVALLAICRVSPACLRA